MSANPETLFDAGGAAGVPPSVARRAVEWLVELQSDDAGDADGMRRRRELQQWRAEHPDNERAWQRIEAVNGQVFGTLRGMESPVASAVAQAALAPPRSRKRRDAVRTLAVLMFTGGAAWVAQERTPWREWVADERTGVGERRTVTLADGTAVVLNTDSAINVRFTDSERRVRLVGGEMLVTTGKDRTGRPFIVETAEGELRPVGTRFAVRQHAGASRVDVFEGAVSIRPTAAQAGQGRLLRAGERARFTRTAVGESVPANDDDTAWADGMLVASGMSLQAFLAELGRHRPGHMSCDAAVAGLRVSGSYPLADTGRILDTLRLTLPVEIHYLTRYWVMVRPARG
ncbi:FecR domain-containing protein [Roseateles sp.]|uniref:FecR domain-containing protein n=1 Tax=Roseateles sp. TaxID=1971397 RepID=UPI0039EB759C